MLIREETPADHEAIREVNRLAFSGECEGALIDRLRGEGRFVASLVAGVGGLLVGHILFSNLPIIRKGPNPVASALAPMAVLPHQQRQGVGSALVAHGLELCRERGVEVVVVLGHPGYYPRFGFSAQAAEVLEAPFAGDAFMALELRPGALIGGGRVEYPKAFFEMI